MRARQTRRSSSKANHAKLELLLCVNNAGVLLMRLPRTLRRGFAIVSCTIVF